MKETQDICSCVVWAGLSTFSPISKPMCSCGKERVEEDENVLSYFNNSASVRGTIREKEKTPFSHASVFLIPHSTYANEKLGIVTLWSQVLLS